MRDGSHFVWIHGEARESSPLCSKTLRSGAYRMHGFIRRRTVFVRRVLCNRRRLKRSSSHWVGDCKRVSMADGMQCCGIHRENYIDINRTRRFIILLVITSETIRLVNKVQGHRAHEQSVIKIFPSVGGGGSRHP